MLDIGTGLPTVNNTHAVAQATAPECRIVYADNDPLVLAHARALLTSTAEGVTNYVDADLRDTDRILREAAKTLDFTQPIVLMLLGILNHIMDTDEANTIVDRLLAALPSGSYLVMSHFTSLVDAEVVEEGMRIYNESGGTPPVRGRSRQELLRYFVELLEPGLVSVSLWRPDPSDLGVPVEVYEFCGSGESPDLNSALSESAVQEPGCLVGGFGLDAQAIHDHQIMLDILALVQVEGAGQLFEVHDIW